MSKVSKRGRGTSFEKSLVRDFWAAIGALNDQERDYLLDKILTPTEKLMLAKRLAIIKELGKGTDYRTIEDEFKVISNTIGRMSGVLRQSPKLLPIFVKIDAALKKKRASQKKSSSSSRRVYGSRTMAGAGRIFGWYS